MPRRSGASSLPVAVPGVQRQRRLPKKNRSRRESRMDRRTADRLPVLPALISWVEAERARTAGMLAQPNASSPAGLFTAAGQTLRRSSRPSSSTCCQPSSPGSAAASPTCRWWCLTTRTNAPTVRLRHCCSNGARHPRPDQ